MARARVLKRAGDPMGAAHAMEEARLLDGQDRFLNGKAAKYWLRAGDVKKAEELLAMFTKVNHRYLLISALALALARSDVLTLGVEGHDGSCRFDRDAMSLVLGRVRRQS